MRKLLRNAGMFGMVAMLAFASSSCKKQDEKASINVRIGQMEEVTFGEERAYIDQVDGLFKWNGLDYVQLYNVNLTNGVEEGHKSTKVLYQATEAAEGQTYAQFFGPSIGECLGKYFVFYPAVRYEAPDGSTPADPLGGLTWPNAENREKFTVEPVQYYTTIDRGGQPMSTIDPNAMALACDPEDLEHFELEHIFGVVNFAIKGKKIVDHIVLQDNNLTGSHLHGLHGYVTLKVGEVDRAQLRTLISYLKNNNQTAFANLYESYVNQTLGYEAYPAGSTLTLDCTYNEFYEMVFPADEDPYIALMNGVRLNQVDPKNFFFSVRPGALANGFTLKIYYTDGTMVTKTANFGKAFVVEPGVMKTIAMQLADTPTTPWD